MHGEDCCDWLLHVRWYGSCVAGDAVVNNIVKSVPGVKFAGSVCLPVLRLLQLLSHEAPLYTLVAEWFCSQHLRTSASEDSLQGLCFDTFQAWLCYSIPSLSTRIVPLRFQAGGRRRRPNLGLVCVLLCNLCYLYSLVKMHCGVLFYLV